MGFFRARVLSMIIYLANFLVVGFHLVEGKGTVPSVKEDSRLDDKFTIKTIYGETYDCVDLQRQPALRHPSLKTHKIQMKPSFFNQAYSSIVIADKSSGKHKNIGLDRACPPGTVPIKRTTKEERRIAKIKFRQFFQRRSVVENGLPPGTIPFSGIASVREQGTEYFGAFGSACLCNPEVTPGQGSASVISIEDGDFATLSAIRVGWMVDIDMFHDNQTRLYGYWGQRIEGKIMQGCFNTYCPGFVQTNPNMPLGHVLGPISIIGGPQYYVKLRVELDQVAGNWWLLVGEDEVPIGYWSNQIFTNLKKGATELLYGGMTFSSTPKLPQMGNGDHGPKDSCRFIRVGCVTDAYSCAPMTVSRSRCYPAGDNSYKGDWKYSFYYGGNGGNIQECFP